MSVFNVKEAAGFLKVAVSTIYAWTHQRRVPFRKVGSKTVFCKEELTAWVQSRPGVSLGELTFGGNPVEVRAGSLKTKRNARGMNSKEGEDSNGNY